MRWAAKHEISLMSLGKAKLSLQKSTQHSLLDIDLLLKHMEHSGRILVQSINPSDTSDDETTLIKFVKSTGRANTVISKKEMALFSLERNIARIEAKVTDCMERASRENAKAK